MAKRSVFSGYQVSPSLKFPWVSSFLGYLENHVYSRLVFKLGTVDGFGVADNSDDGTIGTGRLMEVKIVINQILFYLSQLFLARSLFHDN